MGLDQYLFLAPKDGREDMYRTEEEIEKLPESEHHGTYWLRPDVVEVGYWRKANHIHQWFVEHVQGGKDDCAPYTVHPEVLADLYQRCTAVLEDPSQAPKLLPVMRGFFFGAYEYDEYYFEDIKYTLGMLNELLGNAPALQGKRLVYQSSW